MTAFMIIKSVTCQKFNHFFKKFIFWIITMSKKPEYPFTAPTDPRFPNCNISNYCFRMYYDYHRCTGLFSKTHKDCDYFKKVYTSLCPHAWVEKWDKQIENKTFPRDIPDAKACQQNKNKK